MVRTDNGPPFQGEDFSSFSKDLGFKHCRITPMWLQANGEVERFMDTMLKAIRTAHIEQKHWKQELYRFLRQYRATPHSTTAVAPAEALNNRRFRKQLPQLPTNDARSFPNTQSKIQQNDELGKQRMKHYADKTRNAAPQTLQRLIQC